MILRAIRMSLFLRTNPLRKVSSKCFYLYVIDMMHMRKQIDEMINLADLRKEKDYLNVDIQEMEMRISKLKRELQVR